MNHEKSLEFYRATASINTLVGNLTDPEDFEGLGRQHHLINSEITEAMINLNDYEENPHVLRDDVCDILFTLYGLAHRAGVPESILTVAFEPSDVHGSPLDYGIAIHLIESIQNGLNQTMNTLMGADGTEYDGYMRIRSLIAGAWDCGNRLRYPVEQDYQAVIDSNWTKFDLNMEDALDTQHHYAELDVTTDILKALDPRKDDGSELYIVLSNRDQVGTDGKDYPNGKWVKSKKGFREPVFAPIE